MEKLQELTSSFRSMNTDVQIIIYVPPELVQAGENALKSTQLLFKYAEETLSRFSPESELTRLNLSAGSPFKASPLLFNVMRESLNAARTTEGIFDPTILPSLLASGYDRSFEMMPWRTETPQYNIQGKCRWQDIELDARSSSIYLPPGCCIDLGGIGKGWTVDMAFHSLGDFDNFVIDAGGDIRVKGTKADGSPWDIGIADPFNEGNCLTTVELPEGAICTSTTARRKWEVSGNQQHHLIDPRSGSPSQSGVISATIIADSASHAEIISKTALILGPEEGLRFMEIQPGVSGLLVLENTLVFYSTNFKELAHAS